MPVPAVLALLALAGDPSTPRPREVAFPGFNGLQLKATVEPAGAHPYFAVLVADAGPMDRNWSSPLIRNPLDGQVIPSHAGRDFAAWLAAQGLGSLRYDKRIAGSRDARLDASLDAQAGDVRAALRAARTLPEAAGRKLLLVGHGEGALLALVAAQEADALLLLAPPPAPMRRLILDQARAQLPEALREANLAYLEAALRALGEGRDLPPAGAGVHPAVARMARGLASPESLPFVRATLDLDPWLLAARTPVPLAVAYGDRDVQCRRPAAPPPGFRGTFLDLPGANHLLKRETRPLAGLEGAAAVTAYGDGTPMADLGPLAAWLRDLK